MKGRVLLIEDDEAFGPALVRTLATEGYEVRHVETLAEARREDLTKIEAVLLDIGLPDGMGTELLRDWRAGRPDLPVIFLTGSPSLETAVEALRGGATDYLTKPVSAQALGAVLGRAIEASHLRREVGQLREALATQSQPGRIVGSSAALRRLRDEIRAVAPAPTTVLIQGETGTGKEVVARALHDESGRTGRFVAVNCAAFPEALFEAELFGHKKGSFTGAVADRPGLVAEAEGGTLFLDEVGEIPASLQAKVLRLLANGEYRPVGESREMRAEVRIVAATNRDLAHEVRQERFREDLYWRLAVVTLALSPLRERPEDVEDLAAHFLPRHVGRLGKEVRGFSPEALAKLRSHDWPGNVRELENVLERAVLLAKGDSIEADEIAFQRLSYPAAPDAIDGEDSITREVKAATRERLVRLLETHQGSVAQAAQAAGRNRTAFYALLKRHEIDPAEFAK